MAYGTNADVAGLVRLYTRNGTWVDYVPYSAGPPEVLEDEGTNPGLTQVNKWLDDVSGLMDTALQNSGFPTPVTQADAVKAITLLVTAIVADLCANANSAGRFFSEKVLDSGLSPFAIIPKSINAWIKEYASGLENLGVPRTTNEELEAFSVPPGKQL